jgi:hypothetical protein
MEEEPVVYDLTALPGVGDADGGVVVTARPLGALPFPPPEVPPIRLWRGANEEAPIAIPNYYLHPEGEGNDQVNNHQDSFWSVILHCTELRELLASQPYMRLDIEPDRFPSQFRLSSPKTGPSLQERITTKESTIIPPFEGPSSILMTFPAKHEGGPKKTMRIEGSLLRHHSGLYRKFLDGQSTGTFTDSQEGFSLGSNRKYFRLIWWMLYNPGRSMAYAIALLRKDYLEEVLRIVDFLEMSQVKELIQLAFPTMILLHTKVSNIYQKQMDNSFYHHHGVGAGGITEERHNEVKERILSPFGKGAVVSSKPLILLLDRYELTSSMELLLKSLYTTVRDFRVHSFPLSSMLVEPELYSPQTLGCMISTLVEVTKKTAEAKNVIM